MSPVLEFVEQALDEISPAIFGSVMSYRIPAVTFPWDDSFNLGLWKPFILRDVRSQTPSPRQVVP